jgi:uncharacterized integral membrane protein
MPYKPAPGTTWSMRFWLFVVCICSTVCLLIYRELTLPWYLKLPLIVVIIHAYISGFFAFRASYVRTKSED